PKQANLLRIHDVKVLLRLRRLAVIAINSQLGHAHCVEHPVDSLRFRLHDRGDVAVRCELWCTDEPGHQAESREDLGHSLKASLFAIAVDTADNLKLGRFQKGVKRIIRQRQRGIVRNAASIYNREPEQTVLIEAYDVIDALLI